MSVAQTKASRDAKHHAGFFVLLFFAVFQLLGVVFFGSGALLCANGIRALIHGQTLGK